MMTERAMRSRRERFPQVAVFLLGAVFVAGSSPAQPPKTAVSPQPPAATPPAPAPPPPAYAYNPEGRRDPFISLLARGTTERSTGKRIDGLAGLTAGELNLKGILQSRGEYIALVQGTDTKTYTAHSNDRLFDGRIKTITADSLIILQEVNDPLSLTKQREIRKTLRGLDDVK